MTILNNIYSQAISSLHNTHAQQFKAEAISEVKTEKEQEHRSSLRNRRSYRLSKKDKGEKEDEYDYTKILRTFREEHKNNLHSFTSQNSLDSPKSSHKNSQQGHTKNKRKIKEEIKRTTEEAEQKEKLAKTSKFLKKYSIPEEKELMPSKYK